MGKRKVNADDIDVNEIMCSFDGYFMPARPAPDVVMYDSGWGDEKYYYGEDGLMRHWPARTKHSHPYHYDPIVLIDTGVVGDGSAYSDRMVQWDSKKFYDCLRKHTGGKGELAFSWGNRRPGDETDARVQRRRGADCHPSCRNVQPVKRLSSVVDRVQEGPYR